MKQIFLLTAVLFLSFTALTACSKETGEGDMQEVILIDSTEDEATEDLPTEANTETEDTDAVTDETEEVTGNDTDEIKEIEFVDLKLPFVTRDITAHGNVRITSSGTLQYRRTADLWTWGDWEDMDANVRSIAHDQSVFPQVLSLFYIKNDNSVWGIDWWRNGRWHLDDDTDVESDTPFHILDNVAYVRAMPDIRPFVIGEMYFAILTDKTLMYWDSGQFSPVKIPIDNVIRFIGPSFLVQTSEGFVYDIRNLDAPTLVLQETVFDAIVLGDIFYYIDSNNVFVRQEGNNRREIATDVVRIFHSWWLTDIIHFITSDGTLWELGINEADEQGDETKEPRDEPVKIAENVIDVLGERQGFLKDDGTFWIWDFDNQTTQMIYENVALIEQVGVVTYNIHFNDGKAMVFNMEGLINQDELDNVLIPQTHTW